MTSSLSNESHRTSLQPQGDFPPPQDTEAVDDINQSETRHIIPVPPGESFLLNAGCEFIYESNYETPAIVQVYARREPVPTADRYEIESESWKIEPEIPFTSYQDGFGNHVTRFTIGAGTTKFTYNANFRVPTSPDPQVPDAIQQPLEELPDDVLVYTLSSRYCFSDVLSNKAWELFGNTKPGWARVQAVCDWLHENISYQKGASNPFTTTVDILNQGTGICRDFAHMGITFCRALNIPARYCFGYMPDVGVKPPNVPMDFHAWFEVWLDGAWHTFDARHNFPRIGRVPIARGRDAVDCAMITTYGSAELKSMIVWADPI